MATARSISDTTDRGDKPEFTSFRCNHIKCKGKGSPVTWSSLGSEVLKSRPSPQPSKSHAYITHLGQYCITWVSNRKVRALLGLDIIRWPPGLSDSPWCYSQHLCAENSIFSIIWHAKFYTVIKNRHNNKINNTCPFKKTLTLDILPYHQCTNPGFKQVWPH